jgi:hypothetical protein
MRWTEAATTAEDARRLLARLGLVARRGLRPRLRSGTSTAATPSVSRQAPGRRACARPSAQWVDSGARLAPGASAGCRLAPCSASAAPKAVQRKTAHPFSLFDLPWRWRLALLEVGQPLWQLRPGPLPVRTPRARTLLACRQVRTVAAPSTAKSAGRERVSWGVLAVIADQVCQRTRRRQRSRYDANAPAVARNTGIDER